MRVHRLVLFYATTCAFVLVFILTLEMGLYKTTFEIKMVGEERELTEFVNRNGRNPFLVNSTTCKIPNLNPYNVFFARFVRVDKGPTECATRLPLTTVFYNPVTREHFLDVDPAATEYYATMYETISCCVSAITGLRYPTVGNCEPFTGKMKLDEEHQFILVVCTDPKTSEMIYHDVHGAAVRIREVKRPTGSQKLNVLLLGLDSMSRLNLYRTMPQTVTYLHTHGWAEMRGYTKVADNTLPNLMAALSGMSPRHFDSPHRLTFQHHPFVWKKFSKAGYVTAYAEDNPVIDTFHCHVKGFRQRPTDHYARMLFYTGELLKGFNKRDCIGQKSSSEHLFGYMLDFVRVYKDDSFFGLFWVNQFSHNDLNRPSSEDERVLRVLRQLRDSGTTNTTMVVFMSDHGLRMGESRKSRTGWFEDRLPFLFISLPEWYKSKSPEDFLNLLENGDRLTSPFDLYMTLKHALLRRSPSPSSGCKTCQSLLTRLPTDRSCAEAGVSAHWCACHDIVDLPPKESNPRVAVAVVDTINHILEMDDDVMEGYYCATLVIEQILFFRRKTGEERVYVVGVKTSPGGAEFEGTVSVEGHSYRVDPSVSRLNSYDGESHCALNPRTKLFCFCQISIPLK